jgi:hypothetical protein
MQKTQSALRDLPSRESAPVSLHLVTGERSSLSTQDTPRHAAYPLRCWIATRLTSSTIASFGSIPHAPSSFDATSLISCCGSLSANRPPRRHGDTAAFPVARRQRPLRSGRAIRRRRQAFHGAQSGVFGHIAPLLSRIAHAF